MSSNKIEEGRVEFLVSPDLQGRRLLSVLSREVISVEIPHLNDPDPDLRALRIARVESRDLGKIGRLVSGHPGNEVLVGIYSLPQLPRR